jgi:dimethylargininase
VLLNPAWVDASAFAGCRAIEVDPAEPGAANALRIGDAVVCAEGFPRTVQRLRATGIAVTVVDMDEVRKAEGGPTCCSLVFRTEARG